MAIKIEITTKKVSTDKTEKVSILKIENPDVKLLGFVKYLTDKFPEWEDFILTNKIKQPIRVIKTQNDLLEVPKTLSIGILIAHLDKLYKDWDRFVISKITFVEIQYEECEIGMLVRGSSNITNQYNYIKDIQYNSKGEKELICIQEGQNWIANTVKMKDLKFSLLCKFLDKSKFTAIDWPPFK